MKASDIIAATVDMVRADIKRGLNLLVDHTEEHGEEPPTLLIRQLILIIAVIRGAIEMYEALMVAWMKAVSYEG